jgi:hypothetical protein
VTVLKSRQVAKVDHGGADLEVRLRYANAILGAKEMVPQQYRNAGAIMLAQEWSHARDVDLLTTLQNVDIIQGKLVPSATLLRALAVRAGYEVIVKDVSPQAATVVVSKGGTELGRTTFTIDDAKSAGLLGKDNWKKHPQAMLVARATSQAMRWYAADVMVGVYDLDEVESDAVAVLEDPPEPEARDGSGDIVDAEIVTDVRSVVAGLDEDTAADLKEWWKAQGFPAIDELDAEQSQAILDWIARRG